MSKGISRKARSGRMRVMFMAYPFSYERSSSWVGPPHFCYLLEPCRLKLRPVQNAAPETSAAPHRGGIAAPSRHQLPQPSLLTDLPSPLFLVLVVLGMLLSFHRELQN